MTKFDEKNRDNFTFEKRILRGILSWRNHRGSSRNGAEGCWRRGGGPCMELGCSVPHRGFGTHTARHDRKSSSSVRGARRRETSYDPKAGAGWS